ncbi:MAG: ATP-binding cassette domain-containing protein [Pseudomonadota bacterium]
MIRFLMRCWRGIALLFLLSAGVAALQFVVPLYMMAIYNRILQTQSIETLQLLSLIAAVLLLVLGISEIARSRVLALMARRVSDYLNDDVYRGVLAAPESTLAKAGKGDDDDGAQARTQALLDLRQVSGFVASGALNTFFDAFFAPIFIVALFILHPLLGWIGLGAAAAIFSLAISAEILARRANRKIGEAEGRAQGRLERSLDQYDAIASMGMTGALYAHWEKDRKEALALSQRNQSLIGALSGTAKAIRLVVQMGVLGVGAWLVITTSSFLAGAIIAASIILGRALAPIDQSIALWRPFMQARAGARRLMALMDAVNAEGETHDGPKPEARLRVQKLTLSFPSQQQPLVQGVEFILEPGQALGIFGPNGAGKTTLLRALAGLQEPVRGGVFLDHGRVEGLSEDDRHRHIGFLPQDVQLLPGTMADNITRFRFNPLEPQPLFDAAAAANALPMIQGLPEGFGTAYRPGALSAGQTQLVGLARAVFGTPALVLLDEPTANLDGISKAKVIELIEARKAAGLLTVFVSHDQAVLNAATHLLMIAPGKASIGPKDDILRALQKPATGLRKSKPAAGEPIPWPKVGG